MRVLRRLSLCLSTFAPPAQMRHPASAPRSVPKLEADLNVCYRDKKLVGWHWDVHTDTGEAFVTNDTYQ
jgi:hypothetical protein